MQIFVQGVKICLSLPSFVVMEKKLFKNALKSHLFISLRISFNLDQSQRQFIEFKVVRPQQFK
jgi:hypothetical protein